MRIVGYVCGLLGLGAAVALLIRADLPAMAHLLAAGGFTLLWLVPYRTLYFLCYAIGWQYLLRPSDQDRRADLAYLWWVTSVREAIDRLLPVASIGGGVIGVRLVRWRCPAITAVTASIVVEVILTLIASYLYAVLGFMLVFGAAPSGVGYGQVLFGLLCTLPVPMACILLLRYGSVFLRLQRFFSALVGVDVMSKAARALDLELRACLSRPRPLMLAGMLQFTALLSASFEIWFAMNLFGNPVSVKTALILESATQAVRHVAFFVPGALGVQEAGLILFGRAFGMDTELALALSLVKRMREVLCGLPALISWQWMEAVRLRRIDAKGELKTADSGIHNDA